MTRLFWDSNSQPYKLSHKSHIQLNVFFFIKPTEKRTCSYISGDQKVGWYRGQWEGICRHGFGLLKYTSGK